MSFELKNFLCVDTFPCEDKKRQNPALYKCTLQWYAQVEALLETFILMYNLEVLMNFKETMNYKFEYGAPVALTLAKKIKQT